MQPNARQTHLGVAALLLWLALGVAFGIAALAAELLSPGAHLSDVLRVGEESPARVVIEDDLGAIRVTEGVGHDGQYSYLVARDPFALRDYGASADDGGYRFRRALYGWLAGGFGLLSPQATLWGLLVWGVFGFGLATAAAADITSSMHARAWAVAGVVANVGLWLSVQLATVDALAMGLALAGLALVFRRRIGVASVFFAAAVLTKDTFLLFPLAVGAWLLLERRPTRAVVAVVPSVVVLAVWASWVGARLGGGFSTKGGLGFPFVGLGQAFQWSSTADLVLGGLAIVGLTLAVVGFLVDRTPIVRWLMAPWIVVALLSSSLVWKDGNNAARALAATWTLGLLAVAHWRGERLNLAAVES